jgi:hypothetical protein
MSSPAAPDASALRASSQAGQPVRPSCLGAEEPRCRRRSWRRGLLQPDRGSHDDRAGSAYVRRHECRSGAVDDVRPAARQMRVSGRRSLMGRIRSSPRRPRDSGPVGPPTSQAERSLSLADSIEAHEPFGDNPVAGDLLWDGAAQPRCGRPGVCTVAGTGYAERNGVYSCSCAAPDGAGDWGEGASYAGGSADRSR